MSTLVEPGTPQEVAEILKDAAARGLGVTPVGSGTEAAPPEDAVVLSTKRLAGMEIYEPADLTFTAAAGTTLGMLDEALGAHDQFLPLDPLLQPERTLGGTVATGRGGPLGAGYGLVRDQVLGVTMVTGDGRVLHLGGRVMKNVAGFDLVRLAVGSRGTLGVIVAASLRVFPRPEVDRLLVAEGPLQNLLEAARVVRTAPLVPASAVLVRTQAGGSCRLVVRLHGSGAVVEADQRVFARAVPLSLETHEAPEARSLVDEVRDATNGCQLRVRLTTLPTSVDGLMDAVGEDPFQADIMTGATTVGRDDTGESSLHALVDRARSLGGSALLLSGPAVLRDVAAPEGPAAELADRLRRTFDPQDTLLRGGAA